MLLKGKFILRRKCNHICVYATSVAFGVMVTDKCFRCENLVNAGECITCKTVRNKQRKEVIPKNG